MTPADLIMVRGELDDLLAVDPGLLASSEIEFLESFELRFDDGRPHTRHQLDRLRRIWELNCL